VSIRLAEVALGRKCDVAVLVTGDTDLAPAVRIVHAIVPAIKIGFTFPCKRKIKNWRNYPIFPST
jgi:hypothetical protein